MAYIKQSSFPVSSGSLAYSDLVPILKQVGPNLYENYIISASNFVVPTSSLSLFAEGVNWSAIVGKPSVISGSGQFTSSVDRVSFGTITASIITVGNISVSGTISSSNANTEILDVYQSASFHCSPIISGSLTLVGSFYASSSLYISESIHANNLIVTSGSILAGSNTLGSNSSSYQLLIGNVEVSGGNLTVDNNLFASSASLISVTSLTAQSTYISSSIVNIDTSLSVPSASFSSVTSSIVQSSASVANSLTVSGNARISGSLFATASNAVSASYALNANTASYALYAGNGSASYASTASISVSSSYANSSSYAISASTAITALTASYAVSASYAFVTQSVVITSSFSTSASYSATSTSSSYAISSSLASSAISASYSVYASSSNSSLTSLFAATASYANLQNLRIIVSGSTSFVSGNILTVDNTGTPKLALANSISTSNVFGIVDSSDTTISASVITSGSYYSVVLGGLFKLNSGSFSPGTTYYLSDTVPGAFTASYPTNTSSWILPVLTAISTQSAAFFKIVPVTQTTYNANNSFTSSYLTIAAYYSDQVNYQTTFSASAFSASVSSTYLSTANLSTTTVATASYWSGSVKNAASASYFGGTVVSAQSSSYCATASSAISASYLNQPDLIVSGVFTPTRFSTHQVVLNATSASVTLSPTPTIGDWFVFRDAMGVASTHGFTINPGSGSLISGSFTPYVANTNGFKLRATYISSGFGWSIG